MSGISIGVDVRDMLCAQALAKVAQALARLAPGETLDVRYNTPDVKQDLVVWAASHGHPAAAHGAGILRITRGTPR